MGNIAANTDNVAVLVVSCDHYADLWLPFFHLFKRFWPDCPYSVYLLTNEKDFQFPDVSVIRTGINVSWSDNLKMGLQHIREKYILMIIDDLFLLKPVDTAMVIKICNTFVLLDGNYLRLNPTVRADKKFNKYFGEVSKGAIYRASTVLSLWKKCILAELLRPGESAWHFEIYGTNRSDAYDGFYATWEEWLSVINCVIKGKWRNKAFRKIRAFYPGVDLQNRKTMSYSDQFYFLLKVLRANIFKIVPSKYRRYVKDFIVAGKYDYRLYKDTPRNQ